MKPFNLQAALNGAPVVTRKGEKVVILKHVPEAIVPDNKLIVFFTDRKVVRLYCEDGRFSPLGHTEKDLYMAPTKKELFYLCSVVTGRVIGTRSFDTATSAQATIDLENQVGKLVVGKLEVEI